MPMSPETAGIIQAGLQTAGQVGTAIAQGNINKKTREWNEKIYGQQRLDALADWERQNNYNHPSAQMARLREAGLNPNLVYGNGASSPSAPIRSADAPTWNPRPPSFDPGAVFGSGLAAYFNTETRTAQVDNLRAQNDVLIQDALLKAAQTVSTLQSTENSKFDLGLKSELRQISVDAARASLDKVKADTAMTLSSNERAQAMLQPSLQKAAEEVLTMRANRATSAATRQQIYAQIENIKKDGQLKDLDIQLKKMGISPSDPLYMRVLGRAIGDGSNLGNSIRKGVSESWKGLKSLFGVE
ncbi:DNA pilot protein [Tortoise microvirus 32]|nr:DNA pilot protein [Tortoise microvirus 32]